MLSLKQEFIETICRVYMEKHKPQKYKDMVVSGESARDQRLDMIDDLSESRGEGTTEVINENSGMKNPEHTQEEVQEEKIPTMGKKVPTESFIDAVLTSKNRSFYELINSQEGFLTLQGYFIKSTLLLDRGSGLF